MIAVVVSGAAAEKVIWIEANITIATLFMAVMSTRAKKVSGDAVIGDEMAVVNGCSRLRVELCLGRYLRYSSLANVCLPRWFEVIERLMLEVLRKREVPDPLLPFGARVMR
jgi:hypothetical protein